MDAAGRLAEADAVRRLARRDASLFSDDPDVRAAVTQRLGWVGLAAAASESVGTAAAIAAATGEDAVSDVVLLGMGGSSLAPLVMSRALPRAHGAARLHVLDTTSPWAYLRLRERVHPSSCLVVVSSKSGSTIEPLSLYGVMRTWFDQELHESAGERFVAVTDPGSALETLAEEQGFAAVFHAPPDVGGRYSALTTFGLVPAAMTGVDWVGLTDSAARMDEACRTADGSPATELAAWMVDAFEDGRDKLTVMCSPGLSSLGLWIEQLVAESTGKDGRGIVPVLERPRMDAAALGAGRAVVIIRDADDEALASWADGLPEDTPRIELTLAEASDLGAEFVRWEYATALTGFLLGVNPFDEPNVAEAKDATTAILEKRASAPPPSFMVGDTWVTADIPGAAPSDTSSLTHALAALLDGGTPDSYLAVLAYLPEENELSGPLGDALDAVTRARGLACCLEFGPRYLHSTGQLHKGGAPLGRFLMVTARDAVGPTVPGRSFTLAQLHRAQAEGDFVTLTAHGLPVVRFDMPEPAHSPVRMLAETLRGLA